MAEIDAALEVLQRVFGYPSFRGAQAEIIAHVCAGGDALVLMPTGAGKSLCYQIPALVRRALGQGLGVVVSPLIALMQDQVAALAEVGVEAAFLNSTLSAQEAAAIEARVRSGQIDLLYVAPERLVTDRCLRLLDSVAVGVFAIDEAHCVSQWGHDFRPEYIQLSVLHERFPSVPRVALTATADSQTRDEIVANLALGSARIFVSSFDRPNIRYQVVEKDHGTSQLLQFLRAEHAADAGIVYCMSRKKVDETAALLVKQGICALPYHAGLDNVTRALHQRRFLQEEGIVMVATIAFGMGIDKPNVRFVAHLDLPKSLEGYYQETGRAGRDGEPANAWMAYGLQDVVQQRRMIDQSDADAQFKRVATAKLDAMLGFCETSGCRRVRLLGYFDEAASPCGNCDCCITPPESFDATVPTQKLMSCIYRTGQRFGALHIIDVLRGKETDKVRQWGHEAQSTFGVGVELSEQEWRAIVRQCIALGLISVNHDAYGALCLTGESRAVLKGTREIRLRHYQKAAKTPRASRSASTSQTEGLNADQVALFERLRWWRVSAARRHSVPAYVIFHDATLKEIARIQPESIDALQAVSGVGARKLEAYGAEIVALVSSAAG